MAGGEHEAEQIVADIVVERAIEIGLRLLLDLALVAELAMFSFEQLIAAKMVDGPMFRRRHKPGAGLVGEAGLGPLLESRDQRVLGEFFGDRDVAYHAGETGDKLRLLDPKDRLDGAMWVGSRHR